MAIIVDFVAELRSVNGVSGVVSNENINPIVDNNGVTPSIVYNARGGARESYTKDSFGLRETFIQLDVYTDSYSQLDSLRSAIISHFNGFVGNFNSGAMDGGTNVSSCKIVTTRELIDGQNNEIYRGVIELNILSA